MVLELLSWERPHGSVFVPCLDCVDICDLFVDRGFDQNAVGRYRKTVLFQHIGIGQNINAVIIDMASHQECCEGVTHRDVQHYVGVPVIAMRGVSLAERTLSTALELTECRPARQLTYRAAKRSGTALWSAQQFTRGHDFSTFDKFTAEGRNIIWNVADGGFTTSRRDNDFFHQQIVTALIGLFLCQGTPVLAVPVRNRPLG